MSSGHAGHLMELARSGGVAGITLRASFQSADLDPQEMARIDHILAQGQDAAGAARSRGPDRFTYELTVQDADGPRSVSMGEEDLDQDSRRLLDKLLAAHRSRPGSS